MKQLHIIVKGKVQGVFFRDTTANLANKLNLKGWVRNTEDGNVEIKVQGENLQQFLDFVKIGPNLARVDDLEINEEQVEDLDGFRVFY